MAKNLGFLTSYGLEYVYDFIGKERIDHKVKELENVATMGTRLEDFIGGDADYSYYSGKGPLYIFQLMFNWFKHDLNLALFLYEKSKKYTEENYIKDEPFRSMWDKNIISLDRSIKKWTSDYPISREGLENEKINPYWMEYHFFIHVIMNILFKHAADSRIELVLIEIFEDYYKNSELVTLRFKLDEIMWPKKGLSNDIFMKMETFYKQKKNEEKVEAIRNKAKEQGWRPYIFDNV